MEANTRNIPESIETESKIKEDESQKKEYEIEIENEKEGDNMDINEKEKEEEKEEENPIIVPPIEKEKENEKETDNKRDNYFIATYNSKTNKETKAFNVMAIHLKDDEYSMKYLEEEEKENSGARNLIESENEINITNFTQGFFESPKDGFIKLKVYFFVPIPSLDFLFFDCEDLINVDLSNINTTDMTRISYTFYNCKNLEEVNMTSIETSNVEYMEFLFAGCENLVNIIGLENLNTSSVKFTTGMFFNCKNIQNVNLSSFDLDNLEEPDGMFVNTQSLRLVNLGNSTNANNLFDASEEYNIIIIGNTDINVSQLSGNINIYNITEINNLTEITQSLPCIMGEGEKCAYCSIVEDESNCGGCNEGYYLPLGNQYSRKKCKKCDEGCFSCYAEIGSDISICSYCDYNYSLYEGKCIENCITGYGSSCKECKAEGKNDECLSCNEGYYLDENFSKKYCREITIENCQNATNKNGSEICLNCSSGYILHENGCFKTCVTGGGEKCKTCNPIFEKRMFCGSCNENYFLYNGERSTECLNCFGTGDFCFDCDYIAGERVCLQCYDGYVLINGSCFRNCTSDCKNCYFDGKNAGLCLECEENSFLRNYDNGEYDIYIVDAHQSTHVYNDSSDVSDIYSYIYSDNSTLVKAYKYGFCDYCGNCKTCLPKLDNEYELFCFSCQEGYNLIDNKCEDVQCDISSYTNHQCLTCDKNEKNKCASCHPGYFLNTTNGKCISCIDNCELCEEKNKCLKCKENYELTADNKRCAIGCHKGQNELCKECDKNSLSKCGSCNEGYFLPTNLDPRICRKCPDNCVECYGTSYNITCSKCVTSCYSIINGTCSFSSDQFLELFDLCLDCELNNLYTKDCRNCKEGAYFDVDGICRPCPENVKICHQSKGKIIIDECFEGFFLSGGKCLSNCEIGLKEKCLSCKKEGGKINQCEECNPGFFMPSDFIEQTYCFRCHSEGCLKCSGTMAESICTECNNNFLLFEQKCYKDCEIGTEYKCLTCNPEPGKNNRCASCNEKYYLPTYSTDIDENLVCKKCPDHCINCEGDYDNPVCTKCEEDYLLRKGQCIPGCKFIKNCLYCEELEIEEFPRCTACLESYFFPIDSTKYYDRCYPCSTPGCSLCEGEYEYDDYCLICKEGYEEIYDENDSTVVKSCSKECQIGLDYKCKSCALDGENCGQCNDNYFLEGGMCLLKNYDMFAEYITQNDDEFITLLNSDCIQYMNFDGVDYNDYVSNYFYVPKSGVHKAYIKLREYCSFPYLFANNNYLKTIVFYDNFNSRKIDFMNEGFYNSPNLELVDLSNVDLGNNKCFMNYFANDEKLKEVIFPRKETKQAYYMNGMFKNCKSLTSIDLSSVYNDNVGVSQDMFYGCSSLTSIKIGKFKNYRVFSNNIFNGLPEKGIITVSEEIRETVEKQIPANWDIALE